MKSLRPETALRMRLSAFSEDTVLRPLGTLGFTISRRGCERCFKTTRRSIYYETLSSNSHSKSRIAGSLTIGDRRRFWRGLFRWVRLPPTHSKLESRRPNLVGLSHFPTHLTTSIMTGAAIHTDFCSLGSLDSVKPDFEGRD
jgi:hypothetical protein